MFKFFWKKKDTEIRDLITKELFSDYGNQKKAIKKAAQKSAEDQRKMVEKYKKLKIKMG